MNLKTLGLVLVATAFASTQALAQGGTMQPVPNPPEKAKSMHHKKHHMAKKADADAKADKAEAKGDAKADKAEAKKADAKADKAEAKKADAKADKAEAKKADKPAAPAKK